MPEERTPPILDRRRARIQIPSCPQCASVEVAVVSRTPQVLYLRCSGCRMVWSVPKPKPGAAVPEH